MKKLDTWKQDNPREQSVVILQSIEGNLRNMEERITPVEKALERVYKHLEELRILLGANRGEVGWLKEEWD